MPYQPEAKPSELLEKSLWLRVPTAATYFFEEWIRQVDKETAKRISDMEPPKTDDELRTLAKHLDKIQEESQSGVATIQKVANDEQDEVAAVRRNNGPTKPAGKNGYGLCGPHQQFGHNAKACYPDCLLWKPPQQQQKQKGGKKKWGAKNE